MQYGCLEKLKLVKGLHGTTRQKQTVMKQGFTHLDWSRGYTICCLSLLSITPLCHDMLRMRAAQHLHHITVSGLAKARGVLRLGFSGHSILLVALTANANIYSQIGQGI